MNKTQWYRAALATAAVGLAAAVIPTGMVAAQDAPGGPEAAPPPPQATPPTAPAHDWASGDADQTQADRPAPRGWDDQGPAPRHEGMERPGPGYGGGYRGDGPRGPRPEGFYGEGRRGPRFEDFDGGPRGPRGPREYYEGAPYDQGPGPEAFEGGRRGQFGEGFQGGPRGPRPEGFEGGPRGRGPQGYDRGPRGRGPQGYDRGPRFDDFDGPPCEKGRHAQGREGGPDGPWFYERMREGGPRFDGPGQGRRVAVRHFEATERGLRGAGPRDGDFLTPDRGGRPRPPAPEVIFTEMDTNKDGMIDKDEFLAHHAQHRPPHPPVAGPMAPDGPAPAGPPAPPAPPQ